MNSSYVSRFRPHYLFLIGLVALGAGVWLRMEAHDLWTNDIHMPGTPGTELNVRATDEYKFEASVDIARTLLGLGATMIATTAAAWLFVPTLRPPSVSGRKMGEASDASLGEGLPVS